MFLYHKKLPGFFQKTSLRDNDMNREIEILAPAGSYESLKAAIAAGADAVYIGGSRFGARAYADNLDESALLEAIDYVHLHGCKIYLTINTLLKESELKNEFYEYLLPYYKQGVDAVIVQDIGVLHFVREHFPDLHVHASTQMTITDVAGARFLEKQGVTRVVTARELSLSEVKAISEGTALEVESFVHGALCYCYSGQCLYSSLIGGRSGNRGQCAQPCRLPYKVEGQRDASYVLSLKDICTLDDIPELVEAGITSFKIEGRMKKPEYVAAVAGMYRKYVDLYLTSGKKGYHVAEKDKEILMDLYNRGGFHGGYYKVRNGKEMVSLKRPNHAGIKAILTVGQKERRVQGKALVDLHAGDIIELPGNGEDYTIGQNVKCGEAVTLSVRKGKTIEKNCTLYRTRNEKLLQKLREQFVERKLKEKINGNLILSTTNFAKLVLYYGDKMVTVQGEKAQEAINQPISAERIEMQMRKTGNTEFEFDQLEIELQGGLFFPMQSLNELRREGLKKLTACICDSYRREEPDKKVHGNNRDIAAYLNPSGLVVLTETMEQLYAVLPYKEIHRIYLDVNALEQAWQYPKWNELTAKVHLSGKELFLAMPHIFRGDTKASYKAYYQNWAESDLDGVLIRNYESFEFLKECSYQKSIVLDHNLYQFNRSAKEFWKEHHISGITAPLELNCRELKELGLEQSELVVYGYLPMMISAQCVRKTTKGCSRKPGLLHMQDRVRKEITVKNCCDYCYNIIYNFAPMVLLDQKKEVEQIRPKELRMQFTIENQEQTKRMTELYINTFVYGKKTEDPDMEFTRGHFKRGIK